MYVCMYVYWKTSTQNDYHIPIPIPYWQTMTNLKNKFQMLVWQLMKGQAQNQLSEGGGRENIKSQL